MAKTLTCVPPIVPSRLDSDSRSMPCASWRVIHCWSPAGALGRDRLTSQLQHSSSPLPPVRGATPAHNSHSCTSPPLSGSTNTCPQSNMPLHHAGQPLDERTPCCWVVTNAVEGGAHGGPPSETFQEAFLVRDMAGCQHLQQWRSVLPIRCVFKSMCVC